MANTLRFKRGLVATIPTAVAGEPLFTTDTFDLYIGNGTTNTRFQKYIASGTTSQLLRGDGSLLTMPIVLTSPSNGQVLKYNGTNWVNDSDAGVTGSGTTNYLPKWTSSSALGNSNLINDASGNLGLGVTPSAWGSDFKGIDIAGTTASFISSSSRNISASNTFYNGTSYIYKNSDFALMYWLDRPTGQYRWYNAPSGTAGNAISFTQAMTLTAGGNLLVGTTADNGSKFQVSGAATFSSSVTATDLIGVDTLNITANNVNTNGTVLTLNSRGTVGVMAFQTASTERMRITSGGNVGIGTTSPASKFQIGSVGSTGYSVSNGLAFGNGTQASALDVDASGLNIYSTNNIIFSPNTTERMRITSGGNLGIGNTSASAKLHVTGNILSYTEAANTASLFISANNSYNWQFGIGNNSNFVITEGGGLNAIGTERLRITSGGNVLINTTTDAGYKLDVNGTARVANSLVSNNYIGTTLGSGGVYFSGDPSPDFGFIGYNYTNVNATESVYQSFRESWRIRFGNGATKTMSFGMRVGSAAASAWSEYFSLASGGAATFSSSVTAGNIFSRTANYPQIVFEETTSSTNSLIFYDNVSSTKQLGFRVNSASNVMTLTSTSVGIGTTSPAAKLHLVDSVESEIRTQYSTTSSGKLITGNGFTTIGSITNDPLVFVSNNTERMRFTNGGNLLLGSTSDTGEKFQVTGAGIVSGLFTVSGSTGIPATTATYIRFASGFSSPDIGRMYIGDGSGWKFHMSKRLSSTTTDLITFFDNGSVQTSAPTGYAAKPYKLGEVLDGAVTIPTKSVAVEIDGTVYFLLASTTLP